ncbi:MAG: transposase [Terracidiphilus sp.]|jgi:putative transposase
MTQGLVRYQASGDLHLITFSCHQLSPYLRSPSARSLFEKTLERTRIRYTFHIFGYVVMPEHVHLLLSEPLVHPLSKALQALKLSVSKLSSQHPFWQPRYHDFNVQCERKRKEKLSYIHRNPVRRGLVQRPEQWQWSSFHHYATGQIGIVEIESFWTAARRDGFTEAQLSPAMKTASEQLTKRASP